MSRQLSLSDPRTKPSPTDSLLPVAAVRIPRGELAAANRRHQRHLRARQVATIALAVAAVALIAFGFFANDRPQLQQLAFYAVLIVPIAVIGLFGGPIWDYITAPPAARRQAALANRLYPPNALADNLREVMQTVLDIFASKATPAERTARLAAKLPEAALAFTAFFGRSVDRIEAAAPEHEGNDIQSFQTSALRFATRVSGTEPATQAEVRHAGELLLNSFRRLARARNLATSAIAFDKETIDAITLPRGTTTDGTVDDQPLRDALAALPADTPIIARIREQEQALRRLQGSLTPEDADEWRRIMARHIPGLESTLVNAHAALGDAETVQPFLHALTLISNSLGLLLSRVKNTVVGDLAVQVRFIETRHGDELSPLSPLPRAGTITDQASG